MKDQRPPFLNSQTLKVLVKPAGPHHRDKRSGWLNAAKTCSTVAGISREVLNGVTNFLSLSAIGYFRLNKIREKRQGLLPSQVTKLNWNGRWNTFLNNLNFCPTSNLS